MGRHLFDMVGKKFGRLLVLELYEKNSSGGSTTKWKCLCDCGKITIAYGSKIRSGKANSCGCLLEEYNHRLGETESSFNGLYASYKTKAEQKGRVFELTKEQFKILTESNCFYCGTEPKNIFKHKKYRNPYIYNGVDRVDNSIGYTINNSVSCCAWCNFMKHSKTEDEFLQHIKKIYEHSKLI